MKFFGKDIITSEHHEEVKGTLLAYLESMQATNAHLQKMLDIASTENINLHREAVALRNEISTLKGELVTLEQRR